MKSIIIISLLTLCISILPLFPVEVIPEVTFRLVDDAGKPIPNLEVKQMWKDYSLEFWRSVHFDNSKGNSTGSVSFPKKVIRVSILQYILSIFVDFITGINPHASVGPHAYFYCTEAGKNCDTRFVPGIATPTEIIVKNSQ